MYLGMYLSDPRDRNRHTLGRIHVSARHLKRHGVQAQPVKEY